MHPYNCKVGSWVQNYFFLFLQYFLQPRFQCESGRGAEGLSAGALSWVCLSKNKHRSQCWQMLGILLVSLTREASCKELHTPESTGSWIQLNWPCKSSFLVTSWSENVSFFLVYSFLFSSTENQMTSKEVKKVQYWRNREIWSRYLACCRTAFNKFRLHIHTHRLHTQHSYWQQPFTLIIP